jgi:hypothetical protein
VLSALLSVAALGVGCATSDPVLPGWETDDDGDTSSDGPSGSGSGGGFTSGSACGDALCEDPETPETCPDDCLEDPCGDGLCDAGEDCTSCAEDCGACGATCGDGTCDPSEDCELCADDCGACTCEADVFEPNQGSSSATPAADGVDYCDLSICAGDVDWFRFSTTGSFTATVEFLHAEGDLDFEIYSGITGNYVTGSYSDDDDESVTLSGLTPGTYWARIYGYGHTPQGGGEQNWDYCFRVDL